MKRNRSFLTLGVTLLIAACNDGAIVGRPEAEPEATPTSTPPTDPTPTPTLPPVPGDIEIVMTWDDLGDDWELHLVKPGGRINDSLTDCTWTTCIWTSPDWGVAGDAADDPHKDFDDVDQFGPERIWLAGPETGTYTVLVEHWGTGSPDSDGTITLEVDGQVMTLPKENLPPQHVWTVATIDWPSAVVTPSDAVFDCTASWSGGCTAELP